MGLTQSYRQHTEKDRIASSSSSQKLPKAIEVVPMISQKRENRQSSTAFRLSNGAGSAILAEECQGQTRKRKFCALPLRLDWSSSAKFYCALSQLPSRYPFFEVKPRGR